MSKSRIKTMIIVFFDIRGIVHCEFVPQRQTVNSAFYLEVLKRLKRRIARVRTDIKDTVKLHHDNATSHTAFIITNFLARSNTSGPPPQPGQPFKFTVGDTCDRIKEEFSFLQAQYHTLKLECEKLATEKTEMQRHYVMYYEMSYGLNVEMHKQTETRGENSRKRGNTSSSACSPEAITGCLQGATEIIILEDSDPLHRADISLSEVETAISRLPQGKAAGWDSVPCELVKGFEDFFVGAIHRVILESKLRGALPESSRRNIICLVPKAHGGRGLSGYRPISLPTADYRIVSGILLGRLRRHLPAMVPECQTYVRSGKMPLLEPHLRSIGLPQPFLEWFTFSTRRPMLLSRSNFTRPFKMRKGLRQGCACSAALFSIFTGPLLRHLERALGRGNVLAYADDILLLIARNGSFKKVKTIFDEFRRASGVCVNFTKSKGLWCGAWRDRADSPLGISWSSSSITVGRARAANSLVLAAVLHHLHGYLPCDATIAKLQARLTRFVLGSCYRAAWLPGTVLACPVSVGGSWDYWTSQDSASSLLLQGGPDRTQGWRPKRLLMAGGEWSLDGSHVFRGLGCRHVVAVYWSCGNRPSPILGTESPRSATPTLLSLLLVGACRFLATPSLRLPQGGVEYASATWRALLRLSPPE
ncbi:hypothetical protein LAZ67_10001736 [Cordylochernes scorpioides]|uniref:Reverse transcriptase domain-containing protein n=1 Tax=Cordylochernes scorpioides TaxID=51811 RepID=A0ABY6KZU9_9ARAC|nr:hypothetical protein LAZ67_10001736 [Cordylochernes scorpioides]